MSFWDHGPQALSVCVCQFTLSNTYTMYLLPDLLAKCNQILHDAISGVGIACIRSLGGQHSNVVNVNSAALQQ